MLFYRGQVPAGMAADATIASLQSSVRYPLTYGYCSVGEVIELGAEVEREWLGRRVFAFHPHASHFASDISSVLTIPDSITNEQAVFLPNMETAINFAMDARPLVGERVLIMGLGIVGLLTTHLLRQFPLGSLRAVDGYANRRAIARRWGVEHALSPDHIDELSAFDPDLILELSSNPAALSTAIPLAGFGTRIVVGSWYGDKHVTLPLGGSFHRNRVQLLSSQVSTVDGQFANRWDKSRRLNSAWRQLATLPYQQLISHRLPIDEAGYAYEILDRQPQDALQILLTYE